MGSIELCKAYTIYGGVRYYCIYVEGHEGEHSCRSDASWTKFSDLEAGFE
jgi:hypothetical protein